MEDERKHWLEPLNSDDYKTRKYWQEKKKEAYFKAFENAIQRQATLTDMQWLVARALSRDKSLKEIGLELGVGLDRVNEIVNDIKRKANVSKNQAVARWFLGH